jgi:hypothetical protein|tara:strand:- start:2929 stop:3570 length:642 start_codon:yes stop_codon:yes gene_type:complete
MVMLKQSYRYDQTTARLEVEGLPDFSAGQADQAIGILSAWRLKIVGASELEGKREHLEALMQVVIPYVRLRLSGVVRSMGEVNAPVRLVPDGAQHRLDLTSGQPDIPPLSIQLDDAQLADLVRCLDALRADHRVSLSWPAIEHEPLPRRDLVERIPLMQRLAAPVLGGATVVVLGALGLLLPLPEVQSPKPEESAEVKPETPISDPSQAAPER